MKFFCGIFVEVTEIVQMACYSYLQTKLPQVAHEASRVLGVVYHSLPVLSSFSSAPSVPVFQS